MLVLIFTFLLYILITELVTGARLVRITGENDALMARMRNQMQYTLGQVRDSLLEDIAGSGEEGEGALPGSGPGAAPPIGGTGEGLGGLGGEAEEEADPASQCDSSRDGWFDPQSFAEDEIVVYVWVEDENRKFNILTLLSDDEEFARESRERFVRIVDGMREDTEFDLTQSDGERLAQGFVDYCRAGARTEDIPRPPLKSDGEERRSDYTIPLHLDELQMLDDVDDDLFYDKILDGRVIPGLESHFTVYTALVYDPGDPQKNAAREERMRAQGRAVEEPSTPGGGEGEGAGEGAAPGGGEEEAPPPEGQGIRININTAPPAVLHGLFPRHEMPETVVRAMLEFRNEVEEEGDVVEGLDGEYSGDVDLGLSEKRKVFTSIDDLGELPEFANIADPNVKTSFSELCDVHSDVFTIHFAALYRRNETERLYVLRRAATVVMRLGEGEDATLYTIVPFEDRRGLRIQGVDFPDEAETDRYSIYSEMDAFAQEERAWNPFLPDFYLPDYEREDFYNPQNW